MTHQIPNPDEQLAKRNYFTLLDERGIKHNYSLLEIYLKFNPEDCLNLYEGHIYGLHLGRPTCPELQDVYSCLACGELFGLEQQLSIDIGIRIEGDPLCRIISDIEYKHE